MLKSLKNEQLTVFVSIILHFFVSFGAAFHLSHGQVVSFGLFLDFASSHGSLSSLPATFFTFAETTTEKSHQNNQNNTADYGDDDD